MGFRIAFAPLLPGFLFAPNLIRAVPLIDLTKSVFQILPGKLHKGGTLTATPIIPDNGKSEIQFVYHPSIPGLGWDEVKLILHTGIPLLGNYWIEGKLDLQGGPP